MRARIFMASVLLLSGCGGGGGSAPPALDGSVDAKASGLNADMNRRCTSLLAGTATVTPGATCPQCTGRDPVNAVDGSDESFAALHEPYAMSGSLGMRATAAKGIVFPAGANAAVTLSAATEYLAQSGGTQVNPQGSQHWHLTIRTYLGGSLQEEDAGDISVSDDPNTRHISGLTATLPFDSIEAVFERPLLNTDAVSIDVSGNDYTQGGNVNLHEFCGGFDLTGLNVSDH